jgi:hypothetical protein
MNPWMRFVRESFLGAWNRKYQGQTAEQKRPTCQQRRAEPENAPPAGEVGVNPSLFGATGGLPCDEQSQNLDQTSRLHARAM